jgi:hypothetical protein
VTSKLESKPSRELCFSLEVGVEEGVQFYLKEPSFLRF